MVPYRRYGVLELTVGERYTGVPYRRYGVLELTVGERYTGVRYRRYPMRLEYHDSDTTHVVHTEGMLLE